jgi:hypothetical protein
MMLISIRLLCYSHEERQKFVMMMMGLSEQLPV